MEDDVLKLIEEKHFKNLPIWPAFDVFNKNIDGLVPACRLETWEDFNAVVKKYQTESDGEGFVFRGQHNFRWFLEPSLDRISAVAIQADIAAKQLRNFRLSIRGRVADTAIFDEKSEELWAVGQHHGLATPLLDWTMSPYVALFFAFVDEDPESWVDAKGEPDNHSRAIFILNKAFLEDLEKEDEYKYLRIVEPAKDDHGRLVNQAGLFTLAPYGETLESSLIKALEDSGVDIDNSSEVAKYLCKIHIPNSKQARMECLRQLRKMNIHHGSLFPDLIGASGYCNELIKEHIERGKRPATKLPDQASDDKPMLAKDFWQQHKLPEGEQTLKPLIDSLLVNEELKESVNFNDLKKVAVAALDFVNNSAGVDWYDRPSEKSRLRNIVRRGLKKYNFNENFIFDAADALVNIAAQRSKEIEKAANEAL